MGNLEYADLSSRFVDRLEHAPFAYTKAEGASKRAGQRLDVIVATWILFQLTEATRQLVGQRPICIGKELLRVGRKYELIHRGARGAN
jgi:hypothetical protein